MKFVWIKNNKDGYDPQIWHLEPRKAGDMISGTLSPWPAAIHNFDEPSATLESLIERFPPPKEQKDDL